MRFVRPLRQVRTDALTDPKDKGGSTPAHGSTPATHSLSTLPANVPVRMEYPEYLSSAPYRRSVHRGTTVGSMVHRALQLGAGFRMLRGSILC